MPTPEVRIFQAQSALVRRLSEPTGLKFPAYRPIRLDPGITIRGHYVNWKYRQQQRLGSVRSFECVQRGVRPKYGGGDGSLERRDGRYERQPEFRHRLFDQLGVDGCRTDEPG